jgi:hypothetical protein
MNNFLACFIAVIFARVVMVTAAISFRGFVSWRMQRRLPALVPSPSPLFGPDFMREIRAQEDAKLALEIAADQYSLAPGQATCDELVAAAASFGKTQNARSREMRVRLAEYQRTIPRNE